MSKSKLKILIGESENYSPKAIAVYNKLGQVFIPKSKKEFDNFLSQADVLVVRLGIKVDKKLLSRAKNLKAVATNTTGLNHVDLEEAKRKGVAVVCLRGHTSFLEKIHATPELTWGLILGLIKKIPWSFDSVKNGKWDRNSYAGHELNGKILGILGLGRIGKIIANYAQAFGMQVIATDPNVSETEMKKLGVKKVSLHQLFKIADIVSNHILHTADTEKIVGEKLFKMMKPTALFINTARGELTDENALLGALRGKWIAGAALDVMRGEHANGGHLKNSPLLSYAKKNQNLLIVPHLGGAAVEAWQATEEFLAELVLKHFKNAK